MLGPIIACPEGAAVAAAGQVSVSVSITVYILRTRKRLEPYLSKIAVKVKGKSKNHFLRIGEIDRASCLLLLSLPLSLLGIVLP
jgi:hypothetical protein